MRKRTWVATGLAIGSVAIAAASRVWAVAGLEVFAGAVLGLAAAVALSLLWPEMPDHVGLFVRPGPRQRWCTACGRPAAKRAPCLVCGNEPRRPSP